MSLTTDMLHELFYEKEGKLFNKVNRGPKALADEEAGSLHSSGYVHVKIKYRCYKAHRLIYMLHNGHIPNNLVIDHINRNKADNRIENLRAVTQQKNSFNSNILIATISLNQAINYRNIFPFSKQLNII